MGNPDALYKWIVVSIMFNGFFEERHFSATHSSPHPRPFHLGRVKASRRGEPTQRSIGSRNGILEASNLVEKYPTKPGVASVTLL